MNLKVHSFTFTQCNFAIFFKISVVRNADERIELLTSLISRAEQKFSEVQSTVNTSVLSTGSNSSYSGQQKVTKCNICISYRRKTIYSLLTCTCVWCYMYVVVH